MKNLFAWKVFLECRDEDEVGIPKTRLVIFEVCLYKVICNYAMHILFVRCAS